METKTTRTRLNKTPVDAPQVHCSVTEPVNCASLETYSDVNSPVENSVSCFHWGSGYNSEQSEASMSGQRIFVLGMDGKPLTPCKPQKARKLILGRVAVVVWNKFGQFGIQMLVQTRKHTPKTVLGCDFGTKFEGYTLISGSDNLLNVMWKLPDKKVLVRKLKEKRILRRIRRFRNCRRRETRFNNRSRKDFIAPSQLMMVNSRLKAIKEFFKYYPITKVIIENIKFNHALKRYGRNFSTIEIGKSIIYNFIKEKSDLKLFDGKETKKLREELGLKKSSNKSAEYFNSHCVDSFTLAYQFSEAEPNFNILVVDDTYRPKRRRLHYIRFKKGGIRKKYSTGNFKGIRKSCICEFGQVVGGRCIGRRSYVAILPFIEKKEGDKRISRSINKINWLSHNFKTKEVANPQTDFHANMGIKLNF